jgi:hypothetical protein
MTPTKLFKIITTSIVMICSVFMFSSTQAIAQQNDSYTVFLSYHREVEGVFFKVNSNEYKKNRIHLVCSGESTVAGVFSDTCKSKPVKIIIFQKVSQNDLWIPAANFSYTSTSKIMIFYYSEITNQFKVAKCENFYVSRCGPDPKKSSINPKPSKYAKTSKSKSQPKIATRQVKNPRTIS